MFDPRWDDARERDDGRARVYDGRDRADADPRDGLMHDLDLPSCDTRELVIDRDRVYELNGEDSRTLAAVGVFRAIPERDLGGDRDESSDNDTLDHLRDEGLIRTVVLGEHDQAVVLTDGGYDLLESNRRDRDDGEGQAFYAGINRPRELEHDSHLYAVYREEEARIRQAHDDADVTRVVLEQDLRREYQEFLQDRNRDRSDSDGRPDRTDEEIRQWARDHDLPYFDDRVHFPDFRIEYQVDGRERHNTLKQAAESLSQNNLGGRPTAGGTPHQIVSCPWCGGEIRPYHVKVYEPPGAIGRCVTYCGDATGRCEFSEAKSPMEGLPVMVVDEDIYRRPPSLLIATVDKFAQMPWKGETQHLFGQLDGLCLRHGFLSPEIEAEDTGNHQARNGLPRVSRQPHGPLRPPDLIIQDELHLIRGPLGSMVALYETAVDELCTWTVNGKRVRPKVIASTATIRRASDQVRKLFLRNLEVFPPQGTSIKDSFFAIQRPAGVEYPGRRYLGICAFGRRYPVAMIRVYVAVLAAAQRLYEKYDKSSPTGVGTVATH